MGRPHGKTVFVVVLALAAAAAGVIGTTIVRNARGVDKAQTAVTALCAQRHDLDLRIAETQGILKTHPGKFIFKIPRSLFVSGYLRDLTTRHNLSILDCKE